jgi:osmotically-inducible protein OsmY
MFNPRSAAKCGRLALVAAVVSVLAGSHMLAGQVQAEERKSVEASSTTDNDRVNLEAHHHYQSPADRANDALLITEVKSALADDGVAEDSPVVVDCNHRNILLSGVLKSAEAAKRAGNIAASAPGVVGVKNQLTWHENARAPQHR